MKKFLNQVIALGIIAMTLGVVLLPSGAIAAGVLPQPVSRMLDELAKVSSLEQGTSIDARIVSGKESATVNLTVDSVTNTKDKAEADFSVTIASPSAEFRKALGTNSVQVRGTIRILSTKKAYLYFEQLPQVEGMGIDVEKLEGRWIDLASDDYEQYFSVQGGKGDTFAKSIARLKQAYIDHPAFIFTEQGSTATSYRYKIGLNPMYVGAFLQAMRADGIEVGNVAASSFLSGVRDWTAYLTIDKSTYLPRQATASLTAGQATGKNPFTVSLNVSSDYSAFNKKVNIKKPSKAITLEKLFKSIDPGFGSDSANAKGSDAQAKANISSIRALAEIYYDSNGSYKGMCSDTRIKASLKSAGKSTSCNAAAETFAVSAKLSKGYFCSDSNGEAVVTTKRTVSSKDHSCK